MVIVIMLISAVISAIITAFICNSLAIKRMKEIEQHWQGVCWKNHNDWKAYHKQELDKWQENTSYLIKKAAYDATIKEYKRIMGYKDKPKPPN